jgi:hypothetical protein
MNLSMNGAGSNGIRDLLDILRNLDGDEGLDMPDMDSGMPIVMKAMGDEGERMPLEDEMYQGIDAVTQGGGDLNRPKGAYAAAQPGDNAMAVESIARQLKGLYEEIKNRSPVQLG